MTDVAPFTGCLLETTQQSAWEHTEHERLSLSRTPLNNNYSQKLLLEMGINLKF